MGVAIITNKICVMIMSAGTGLDSHDHSSLAKHENNNTNKNCDRDDNNNGNNYTHNDNSCKNSSTIGYPSTPETTINRPQLPSNEGHKPLHRGTLGDVSQDTERAKEWRANHTWMLGGLSK